jgi:hypothetical protein
MATVGSEKADKILSASLIRSLEVASTANQLSVPGGFHSIREIP